MSLPKFFHKLIIIARKLGILRYGTKQYHYTSGRDMPPEALLDDVYDSDKDLMTLKQLKGVVQGKKLKENNTTPLYCCQCGAKTQPDDVFCSICGASIQ